MWNRLRVFLAALGTLIPLVVWAAFATIANSGGSDAEGNTTSHAANALSPSSGDLSIIYGVCNDSVGVSTTVTITPPSGYSAVTNSTRQDTSGTVRFAGGVYTKVATGSEGSTVTFSTNINTDCAWITYRITTGTYNSSAGTNGMECASVALSFTGSPDPPSLSPTGGAKDYVWFASATGRGDFGGFPIIPSGYGNKLESLGAGLAGIAVTRKTSTSASDDPGTFDNGGTAQSFATTCVVHPFSTSIVTMSKFREGRE